MYEPTVNLSKMVFSKSSQRMFFCLRRPYALPQSIAPAIAPIFLAIGGGGNYTAPFIAAAVFALVGALSIQPIKGVR